MGFKKANGKVSNPIDNDSLLIQKIFELLESDKYGWNKIREVGGTQMEIYRDVIRATREEMMRNN